MFWKILISDHAAVITVALCSELYGFQYCTLIFILWKTMNRFYNHETCEKHVQEAMKEIEMWCVLEGFCYLVDPCPVPRSTEHSPRIIMLNWHGGSYYENLIIHSEVYCTVFTTLFLTLVESKTDFFLKISRFVQIWGDVETHL